MRPERGSSRGVASGVLYHCEYDCLNLEHVESEMGVTPYDTRKNGL